MKKKILTILILVSFVGYAQKKQFEIKWNGTKILEADVSKVELPSFDSKHFNFSFDSGLQYFSQWSISSLIDENSVELTNVVYQPISKAELKDLPIQTIPNSPKIELKNSIARNNRSAFLTITPIINDGGTFKKVTSFSIKYNNTSNNRTIANRVVTQEIMNSVLSTGNWYRFYVDKSGVFKLSKGFLSQLGVNTNSIDPRTIKVFGNGGAMLPMLNSEPYPIDLTENAIQFIGEEDGVFNNEDYILFYAEGPTEYNEVSDTNINVFTDKSYYYVNDGNGLGKRMLPMAQPEQNADFVVNTFQDYQFYEVDENNLGRLGRRWFGDDFNIEANRTYDFSFPNLVLTEPARVKVLVAAVAEVSTDFNISINGSSLGSLFLSSIDPLGSVLASSNIFNEDISLTTESIVVDLTYNNNSNPSAEGYLDYISIEATRALTFEGSQLKFKNNEVSNSSGIVQYDLTNTSSVLEVWDTTDKYNVTSISNISQDANFSFKAQAGTLRKYVAYSSSGFFTPLTDSRVSVANQNIKGTIFLNEQGQFQEVDYIIVTPTIFLSQAERLAQLNREKNNLNVKVLTLEDIYTEFSSGNQDISAIRNMVRYVYNNAITQEGRLKYLCLFGDGSYDYKNRIPNNTNLVPAWYSKNSFNLTSSYVTDDFYGLLDDNEGGNVIGSDKLDIAIGRILADTPQRAKEMVDKIEVYYHKESYGSWRNNFLVISDDVNEAWEQILQSTTDGIANEISSEKPFLNYVKIHADAFQQQSSAAGDRYPDVNKAIKDAIEVGALVVNYFGHGGEDGLAAERIFDKIDAQEINNVCKFNCFVTITCEYTKFDDPNRITAGEYTFWNKNGGAIGLITTTRQIFVTNGVSINVEMEKYLFAYGSNEYPSMAEALRLTKIDPNISGIQQRRLVFFIGDPAMKLAFPKPNIKLTKINNVAIGQGTADLKALSRTKLSGEVVDAQGNLITNYNGVLTATVYDKVIQRQTLGNDGVTQGGQLIRLDFETLGEIIFKGQATIENGLFEFEFIVPRDIGIPLGNGKVSFYAVNQQITEDKTGHSFDIRVGGINENAEEDNIGPVINLFMNDENFVSGGITNESPTFLAKLQDNNGINTVSGIGHDITAILDGDETNPFVLNDYYQANVDEYQNGTVTYPFRDLEPGLHTLTLKAWDVYNNSSISELQFVVFDKDETLKITNVLNYPNPFVNYTEFWFNHNSSESLDVSVQIFTVSGKLVRTLNGQTSGGSKSTSSLSKDIVWDGRDDFGDKIGKGVYVYKLKVRSNSLNKQVEKIQKLVIL